MIRRALRGRALWLLFNFDYSEIQGSDLKRFFSSSGSSSFLNNHLLNFSETAWEQCQRKVKFLERCVSFCGRAASVIFTLVINIDSLSILEVNRNLQKLGEHLVGLEELT